MFRGRAPAAAMAHAPAHPHPRCAQLPHTRLRTAWLTAKQHEVRGARVPAPQAVSRQAGSARQADEVEAGATPRGRARGRRQKR